MNPAGTGYTEVHVPPTTENILSDFRWLGGRRDFIRLTLYSLRTEQAYHEHPRLGAYFVTKHSSPMLFGMLG